MHYATTDAGWIGIAENPDIDWLLTHRSEGNYPAKWMGMGEAGCFSMCSMHNLGHGFRGSGHWGCYDVHNLSELSPVDKWKH